MNSQKQENFLIRPMTQKDLQIVLNWAKNEGWNPGINDANNYYIADPGGFLIGELDGVPISSISVVRYNENFNFIGLYIVKPEYRHQGYGLKTFQAAFDLIPEKQAALDAVLEQINNYATWGFKSVHSHLRYRGVISAHTFSDVVDLKSVNFEQLCHYDAQYFPSYRPQFLNTWINQPNSQGYAIIDQEEILGYGVIRKASEGFKIAPLFAENSAIAEKLLLTLANYAPDSNIYLDVPNINAAAITLAEGYQMQAVFECKRMDTGEPPLLDWNHIFGVTSLEIG